MIIDMKAMLHRVVDEVFDETFAVTHIISEVDPWLHCVQVRSRSGIVRAARIRASYEWMDAFIPELEVGTSLFDYDDVEDEKEVELRRLCLVIRAYLEGEGHIEKRRRIFGLGTTSTLRIEVDGFKWDLGRSWSSGPYPA
ncbi:hypothetical protein [Arthrobacter sp. PL16]|uniref:hypothetical protein n=1 Tax=Arthrobacter sp. PL16 TaxID=3071720 RepID=UPI002E0D3D96